MIKSFKHRGLEKFFKRGVTKSLQPNHVKKINLILGILNAATTIKDCDFPGSDLHSINPKKDKIWSIHVNGNWCITFKFEEGDVYIVDYLDYH